MARGEGRIQVVDEQTARQYAWVRGDLTCPLLLLFSKGLGKNSQIYVKGCERAGIVISKNEILMEESCPADCGHKKRNQ